MQVLDRDAAADKVVVEPVQLGNAVANIGLERRRGRHVVEDDFDGDLHRLLRSARF
jgi:hypothetical protein